MLQGTDERDEILAGRLSEALEQWRSTCRLDKNSWKTQESAEEQDFQELLDMMCALEAALRGDEAAASDTLTPLTYPTAWLGQTSGGDRQCETILGRYHVVGQVGSGGMGAVYRAEDTQLKRTVAIKVPRFEGPPEARRLAQQRFLREAQSAARVRHPSICPVYDVGEFREVPYVVMAYVAGGSLADRLAAGRRFEDCRQAALLIARVAEGLAAVHDQGLIHRDIKPGNILLDGEQPLLTDFGLARALYDNEHLTADGALVGTPAYMAPEQASTEGSVGPLSDIYSLGVVLYHLLTGRTPFEGPPLLLLHKLTHQKPPAPRELRPDIDPELEQIVLRAMAAKPADRYPNAGELAAALSRWASSAITVSVAPAAASIKQPGTASVQRWVASPPARHTPTPGWRQRRWILAATCLVGVLLAGGIAARIFHAAPARVTAMVTMKTTTGELIVTVPETGVRVFVDGQEQADLKSDRTVTLRPEAGKHRLSIRRGEQEVYGVDFRTEAGQQLEITASWPLPPRDDDPLRGLVPENIPAAERLSWLPHEVVAVLGSHAWRTQVWGYPGHPGLAFAKDGKSLLVTRLIRDRLLISDAATGQQRSSLQQVESSCRCFFREDGRQVAVVPESSGRGNTCRVIDLESGRISCRLVASERFMRVAISGDGQWLAGSYYNAGGIRAVTLFDAASGEEVSRFPIPSRDERAHPGQLVAFSGDGKRLAIGDLEEQDGKALFVAQVWDIAGHRTVGARITGSWAPRDGASIALSRDGATLAAGGVTGGHTRLWEVASGKQDAGIVLPGHSFAFAPDGKHLACWDGIPALYDLATGKLQKKIGTEECAHLAFSPDGKQVATLSASGAIRLWNLESGKQLNDAPRRVSLLAVAPDGKTLAVQRGRPDQIEIWDASRGKPTGDPVLMSARDRPFWTWEDAVTFDPSGKYLACVNKPLTVRLLEVASGDDRTPDWNLPPSTALSYSPDGKSLLQYRDETGEMALYDAQSWKLVGAMPRKAGDFGGHEKWAFSPDGALLAVTSMPENLIEIWNTRTGKQEKRLHFEKQWSSGCPLAFSRDGKHLAFGGREKVSVFDVATGQLETTQQVPFPSDALAGVGFDADDHLIVASILAGRILVDAGGKKPCTIDLPWKIDRFVVSPNGRHAFVGNANGTIYVLRLPVLGRNGP